ncbi:hypothetical protein [Cellulomonas biazotea]|uniref:Uncharacterized protein n=1 Tax=Cellulomonas biazotea TaxID=1709 RepID=A0A402DUW5_9CELL|nr:hypothetical protein [Cellulomonas biazotea]GCE77949.1 hypothetical protein CBZ_30050 [Cellulomonas biazotea]
MTPLPPAPVPTAVRARVRGRRRPALVPTAVRGRPRGPRALRAATAAVLALLGALLLGAVLPVGTASASRLDVQARPASVLARAACTTTAVEVVPTTATAATAVRLDGLGVADESACAGAAVTVTLLGGTDVLGTAGGTFAGADQTYPLGAPVAPADVTRVRVVVDGFVVPATWRAPGPPPDSCRVVEADGTPVATPCTVVGVRALSWWGEPGPGYGQVTANFSAPGIAPTQHVEFTFTVPAAHTPAWWSWPGVGITGANNTAAITSRCADLPTVTGMVGANLGPTPEVYLMFAQQPSTSLCQP